MAMLSLLALIPLGGVELCVYTDLTIGGPTEDCSGNVNTPDCHQAGDNDFNTCTDVGTGDYQKLTCSGDSITWAYHAKSDCSDAVSRTCVFVDLDPSKVVDSSCSIKYKFGECGTALSALGMGVHMKFTGSCPGSDDDPCFSREAEACPPVFPPPPPPTPQPPRPSLPPGATIETVSAKEVTLVLKAVGTVEEYEAKADSVKKSLRQQLQCILPACMLTVTVEAGSVILTVVATDTAETSSQVESAAMAIQTKPLDEMSNVLGITIKEVPTAPSVRAVQVEVTRLAPSPPPQVTQLAPSPPSTSPDHCSVQDCERNLAEGQADYQQAVAAGQKDGQDGLCMLAGLLLANPSECTTTADSFCTTTDFTDCNCGIDNAASFEGVSDCPDLHARMERVCEKLRACDAPSPPPPSAAPSHPPPSADVSVSAPAPPPWCHRCRTADVGEKGTSVSAATEDAGPGLAIGLALGGCLLVAMLAAAVFVWHRKRRTQTPTGSSTRVPQQVAVTVEGPESQKRCVDITENPCFSPQVSRETSTYLLTYLLTYS